VDFVVRLDSIVVDFYKTIMDTALNFGTGYVGQAVHQKLINSQGCLASIGYDAVMFKKVIIGLVDIVLQVDHGAKVGITYSKWNAD